MTSASALSIAEVDALDEAAFAERFGDVAEHSPWVAIEAARRRPFGAREAMLEAFLAALAAATEAAQLDLIRAHPDLAGKAALAGRVTDDSQGEQAGAGLDSLTPEELARFTKLNERYRARFGFPFILAVKRADKHRILAAFEERLGHSPADERATALGEIGRIVRFRLEARVRP